MKVELTDRYLRSLKPPATGRLEISDTKRPGLRFRLSSHGNAVWMYEKRVKGGSKRKHTLGAWPQPISLSEARLQALALEAEAARGFDRIAEAEAQRITIEAAKASIVTVQQVLTAYDSLHLINLKTRNERCRQLNQSLGAFLGDPITALSKKNLQAVVDKKASAGHGPYANRIRAALMAFSKWAWERGYLQEDIAAGIPRAVKETARERVLSITEVQTIWKATFDMGEVWGPILRLLLLTCQRRGEILGLLWSDVDFDGRRIVIPGSRTKNSKPQITHLSEPAYQELMRLRAYRSETDLIFTTTGSTPVSGIGKAKARLDRLLEDITDPWRLHDIRTAFATAMAEAGVPESVADRVLNHSASGSAPSAVARVYNRAEQLPQRAMALDKWAEMVTGGSASVVRMVEANA